MVTASVSLVFLRGHLAKLQNQGWSTGVASAPSNVGQLEAFALQEGAQAFPLAIEREISPRSDLQALWQTYQTLRRFRPTVLNVGTPKAGLVGGLAGVAAQIPLRIYTVHGLRLETTTGIKRRILTLAERIAMACAHRVVCVSPSLRGQILQLRLVPAHKTIVLGAGSANGISIPNLPDFLHQTLALREKFTLSSNTPVVGFVGRFTRDKGIAELMAAFRTLKEHHPESKLLLVGDYEEGDPIPPALRNEIDQEEGVIKAGFVKDVTPYYPLMTILALPTYREGFPTVALEAAALGVPLVTTTATGARDAVRDGRTGWLVPVGDAAALAHALSEALADPKEAIRRGAAGRAWVATEFVPADVHQRWSNYYNDLLEWRRLSGLAPLKRGFDTVISASALAVLAIPLSVLALIIRSKLGSPVLFQQIRPGLGGQPFIMHKFRTMTDERDSDGGLLPDEQRLTPFGKFLRSSSLDELPGLVNVLRGEMSLVGPRPLLMEYLPLYSPEQARRHQVRPGITGWAQVNGRNALSWEKKFEYDVWYVDHRSFLLDLRILWMTVQKVLKRDGISAPGEATMSRFEGAKSSMSVVE
ncbi:glycosyltransferase [Deinococcus sp. Arct2-2]|uniref:sugar transferase n=1 Tax=Deinococcus sp. Arct2-2 TaxID=2568653 RepID=UPI0010A4ADC0|nr:sugar transferase [Deinococcus sp. Arct2-2]THF69517.1 glycosyltransferase [Deinococcus sp. Arct2-2]